MIDADRLSVVERFFEPILTSVTMQELSSSTAEWSARGFTVRILRGLKMRSLAGLFDEFSASMQFPLYFGENQDAYSECLQDLEGLAPGLGHVLVVTDPEQVPATESGAELRWFVRTLRDAAVEWMRPVEAGEVWDRPAVPFHVVLAGPQAHVEGAWRRWASLS